MITYSIEYEVYDLQIKENSKWYVTLVDIDNAKYLSRCLRLLGVSKPIFIYENSFENNREERTLVCIH